MHFSTTREGESDFRASGTLGPESTKALSGYVQLLEITNMLLPLTPILVGKREPNYTHPWHVSAICKKSKQIMVYIVQIVRQRRDAPLRFYVVGATLSQVVDDASQPL